MKTLIVEDEETNRLVIETILRPYGQCDSAIDGNEGIEAFKSAFNNNEPYDLICMDIMMPKINGHVAMKNIREFEREKGIKKPNQVKVIMTTALGDQKNVVEAFYKGGAATYIVKPIRKEKLLKEIRKLRLID